MGCVCEAVQAELIAEVEWLVLGNKTLIRMFEEYQQRKAASQTQKQQMKSDSSNMFFYGP